MKAMSSALLLLKRVQVRVVGGVQNATTRCFALGALGLSLWGCLGNGLVGGECRPGLQECGGICVDISLDQNHCGGCGNVCSSSEHCALGLCRPGKPAPSMSFASGAPSDTPSLPDAGTSGSDGGPPAPSVSMSVIPSLPPDAGPEELCIPPFNSAEQCGACDIACGPSAPFCGDLGDGYKCLTGCPPELALCDDRCADTSDDEWNCGGCGNVCPTGICRDSKCVGGHAGHFVAICANYTRAFSMSPQSVLLGNALFLSSMNQSRIMLFESYASSSTRKGVRDVFAYAETTHNALIAANVAATEQDVVSALNARDFDVFLLSDPVNADATTLRNLGASLGPVLRAFMLAGGSVIVMNGSNTPQIAEFLGASGAGLLDIRGVVDVTFTELLNRAPADSLAQNVLSPFLALNTSCVFDTDVGNSLDTNVVITGKVGTETSERPHVFHRVVVP